MILLFKCSLSTASSAILASVTASDASFAVVILLSEGVPKSNTSPKITTKSITSPVAKLLAKVSVDPDTVNESPGACSTSRFYFSLIYLFRF